MIYEGTVVDANDNKLIMDMYQYGEKTRERAFRNNPDDIWALRGYAWGLHVGARFKERIEGNISEAMELINQALKIRLQCEEKLPADSGVKEDIIKNYLFMA